MTSKMKRASKGFVLRLIWWAGQASSVKGRHQVGVAPVACHLRLDPPELLKTIEATTFHLRVLKTWRGLTSKWINGVTPRWSSKQFHTSSSKQTMLSTSKPQMPAPLLRTETIGTKTWTSVICSQFGPRSIQKHRTRESSKILTIDQNMNDFSPRCHRIRSQTRR